MSIQGRSFQPLLKEQLKPYKHALFRFLTVFRLNWRRQTNGAILIRRVATSTLRYLSRRLTPTQVHQSYIPIDAVQPYDPPPAKTIGVSQLTNVPPLTYQQGFVVHFNDVRVLSDVGHILTQDGTLLADLSIQHPDSFYQDGNWQGLPGTFQEPKPLAGTTCVLASNWAGSNYFHFLFEMLPRCEMVRRSGIPMDSIDQFVVNYLNFDVCWQALGEFGIGAERVRHCHETSVFACEHVIATSSLRGTGHTRKWVCDWLKQTFGPPAHTRQQGTRLYIGRDDANRRHLENQAELLQVLSPLGFQPINWDGRSIREQAALFAKAEIIVGLNGAALTNLVFCKPGTRVLVLHHPGKLSRYFYELCHTLYLDYYYLVGEIKDRTTSYEYATDYAVNPSALAALLQLANVH